MSETDHINFLRGEQPEITTTQLQCIEHGADRDTVRRIGNPAVHGAQPEAIKQVREAWRLAGQLDGDQRSA